MKNRILWSLRLVLIMIPLAICCARETPPPPAPPTAQDSSPAPDAIQAISEAPAVAVSAERPAPPNVRTDGPVGDLIKLANAGVDTSVLLAFATNSANLFSLNADEIIYLSDLGVPSGVVTAVLQHDQALKDLAANPNPPSSPPIPWQVAPGPGPQDAAGSAPEPETAPPDYPPLQDYSPPPEEATEPLFYDTLSPYGNWVQVDGAGLCWQPSAAVIDSSWQPYFDGGHWVFTDCGWYWASDYSWGWAPFHYGRWFHHHQWGWCWAPDTVWGAAWVSWRHTNGYCGWAPLPPGAWYRPGIGLTFNGRGVGAGFSFGLGADSFAFVPWSHFNDRHLRPWTVGHDRIERIYRQSTAVTRLEGNGRAVSNYGLSAEYVASATHRPVHAAAITEVKAPAAGTLRAERLAPNGRTLSVFRPTASELRRAPAAISGRTESAAVRPGGPASSQATARNVANPPFRSFGESRPVPLDPAERSRALGDVRLSTGVRAASSTFRAQPAWLAPRAQEARNQPAPAQGDTPRPSYQAPAQREYRAQTYQATAEVPRYHPAPERSRPDPSPSYSSPPRAYSAPAPAPAPSPGQGPQPRTDRSGR